MSVPQGKCFAMCSEKERLERERENLLNLLEIDEKTRYNKMRKADPSKTVKCYKRSSAGMNMTDPKELRPGAILILTVRYLLSRVVYRKDVNWSIIYEFLFDRLRAVRQDMNIQRLDISMSIRILEPIARFFVYSQERMRNRSLTEFIPKYHSQQLLECIKELLVRYDNQENEFEVNETKQLENQKDNSCSIDNNRAQIEALYILLYLGDVNVLNRGLSLPLKYRVSPEVKTAMDISQTWYLRNYVQACRKISQLSSLFIIAAYNNLESIRRTTLQIMSASYKSKNLTYPGEKLKDILLYKDMDKIAEDCKECGLSFNDGNIHFQGALSKDVKITNPGKQLSDFQLDELLRDLIPNSTYCKY